MPAAFHFDVDTIDSNEIALALSAEPEGLTRAQVQRIVTDLVQQILKTFPPISGPNAG